MKNISFILHNYYKKYFRVPHDVSVSVLSFRRKNNAAAATS